MNIAIVQVNANVVLGMKRRQPANFVTKSQLKSSDREGAMERFQIFMGTILSNLAKKPSLTKWIYPLIFLQIPMPQRPLKLTYFEIKIKVNDVDLLRKFIDYGLWTAWVLPLWDDL
jgi:hypothetical protein